MLQLSTVPVDLPADCDHRIVAFPTLSAAHALADTPPRSARSPVASSRITVRTDLRQVVVLEVTGRLDDLVQDLDQAIQLALVDSPRGVVCDLSAVSEGAQAAAVEVLATAGRHVRDWPATPVAVACPNPRIRYPLRTQTVDGGKVVWAILNAPRAQPHTSPDRRRRQSHVGRA